MRKKTLLNVLLIIGILSFFVTPLGDEAKIVLNRLFSFSPEIIEAGKRERIKGYNWQLKDAQWDSINFSRSRGKVVFINFWASWRLPCTAELSSIQQLYDRYSQTVDFYIITNEERMPVEAFMKKHDFDFPVTYLNLEVAAPVLTEEAPRSYIIDREGLIAVNQQGIADWDNPEVYQLLNSLRQ